MVPTGGQGGLDDISGHLDVMDLAMVACRFEQDHNLRDEVPVVLLAGVRTVREFLELIDGWERDTLLDLEPMTLRNGTDG